MTAHSNRYLECCLASKANSPRRERMHFIIFHLHLYLIFDLRRAPWSLYAPDNPASSPAISAFPWRCPICMACTMKIICTTWQWDTCNGWVESWISVRPWWHWVWLVLRVLILYSQKRQTGLCEDPWRICIPRVHRTCTMGSISLPVPSHASTFDYASCMYAVYVECARVMIYVTKIRRVSMVYLHRTCT